MFNIPWIGCDRIKKEKTVMLEVIVPEDDVLFESSVLPSITAGCCFDDNNNSEHDVGNILIDMSNMNNDATNEFIIGNDVTTEIHHHDLPNNNIPSNKSSSDSSFCLSSRDEEDNESMFGSLSDSSSSSSSSSSSIYEENNKNDENVLAICLPVSEENTNLYGRLSCDFISCTSKGVPLKCIQRPITTSVTASKRNYDRMVNTIKEEYRHECLERIGIVNHKKDKRQKIRFCYQHRIETITKQVEWISKTKKKETKKYTNVKMNVPMRFNIESFNHHRSNRGIGVNRNVLKTLDQANTIMNNSQNPLERAAIKEMIDLQRNFGFDDHENQNNTNETINIALGCNNNQNTHDNTKIGIISYDGMRKNKRNESEANDDDDDQSDGVNNNDNNNIDKKKHL